MRLLATMLAALTLVAGCSQTVGGQSEPAKLTPAPAAAPDPGAPIGDVTAWVAAGEPVDAADYHSANRDGTTVDLGDDVAFTTPSGKTRCATMASFSEALMCLVELKNPPPRPTEIETHWAGGWVEFDGQSLSVGSFHGDAGPFVNGDGPQLPYGKTLKFGDYQCRSDQVGLYCVNLTHQSAARYSDAGIEPFGCLRPVPPPEDIGLQFSC
jgi:hypothetical protein